MEFYLSIEGEKHGPVSLFRVGELLSEGTVTSETLGWHRGMGGWLPIEEIPALQTIVEREGGQRQPPPLPDPAAEDAPGGEVRLRESDPAVAGASGARESAPAAPRAPRAPRVLESAKPIKLSQVFKPL